MTTPHKSNPQPIIPLVPLKPAPRAPQPPPRPALEVLDVPLLGRFLRWKHARIAMQFPLLLIAALMVWDGLTGSQLAPRNLATVITWVQYRGLLVLALLVAGNLFCMACPFMLPRNLARKLFAPTRMWPKQLRNKWVAGAMLVAFLFCYEYFDLWATPWWTAWLIVGYFAAALVVDSLFRGAPFCKYVCPIGQFNFVSSLVSPLEVKVRSPQTCATCTTKDCIKGNEYQHGCELWLFQERKVGNMDCTFCLDCVHACPHDNVGISTRVPGSDLWAQGFRSGIGDVQKRPDLAALVMLFTFGGLLNAFAMTTPVYALQQWFAQLLGASTELPTLSALFTVGLVIEPVAVLALAAWVSRALVGRADSVLRIATRYAIAFAPLGFGIWLAHYAYHFALGFWTIVPVAQGVLASVGLPSFGAPRWDLGALFAAFRPLPLQFGFIGLGATGALFAVWQLARQEAPQRAWQAAVPWMIVIVGLACAAMWIMFQPMEMRGLISGG